MRFIIHLLIGLATLLAAGAGVVWFKVSRQEIFLSSSDKNASEEIDRFGKKFDSSGLWPDIELPPEATADQIIEKVTETRPDLATLFTKSHIILTKTVNNPDSALNGYTVTLVESQKGTRTFVVYVYDKVAGAWTVREFNNRGLWPVADP